MDSIYCINLKDCLPRKNLMISQFKKHGLNDKAIFIDAYNIENQDVKNAILDRRALLYLRVYKRRFLSYVSQVAISMSHFTCWANIYKNKNIYGCIIEDDVKLCDHFMEKYVSALRQDIKDIMKLKPCILWLTGLSAIKITKDKTDNSSFRSIGPQYGNCMYIINHMFARLLISHFYPIEMPSDDYIMKIVREHKIANFSLIPPIAYDLSSEYYKKFWIKEDHAIQKQITRQSCNILIEKFIKVNENNFTRRIKFGDLKLIDNAMYTLLFKNTSFENLLPSVKNVTHYLIGTVDDSYVGENSIICGAGFATNFAKPKRPLYTKLINGPKSRQKLLDLAHPCPVNYGNIMLILPLVFKNRATPKDKIIFIPNNSDFEIIKKEKFPQNCLLIDPNTNNPVEILNHMLNAKYVITTSLPVLAICHAYGINVCAAKTSNLFPFLDHFESVAIKNPYFPEMKGLIGKEVKNFLMPEQNLINSLQKNIINTVPFISDLKI